MTFCRGNFCGGGLLKIGFLCSIRAESRVTWGERKTFLSKFVDRKRSRSRSPRRHRSRSPRRRERGRDGGRDHDREKDREKERFDKFMQILILSFPAFFWLERFDDVTLVDRDSQYCTENLVLSRPSRWNLVAPTRLRDFIKNNHFQTLIWLVRSVQVAMEGGWRFYCQLLVLI